MHEWIRTGIVPSIYYHAFLANWQCSCGAEGNYHLFPTYRQLNTNFQRHKKVRTNAA